MVDIKSDDGQLLELALFAGAGGGILGGKLLGWRTVCAVEINAYAASILVARQNDGCLEPFPIWDDICTFRSDNADCGGMFEMLRAVRHRLVVSGGFPCTDISTAGHGAGIDGEFSGLWREQARILREIRPRFAFVENSAAITRRGLDRVLKDLAEMGFDARWGVLGGTVAGFPHHRNRMWITADSERSERWPQSHNGANRRMGREREPFAWDRHWLDVFTRVRGVNDGMARHVDRTDAIRNGQIPRVAATAWRILSGESD